MNARDAILDAVRAALVHRAEEAHPGPFDGARPVPLGTPVEAFSAAFHTAGGEVVEVPDTAAARSWLQEFTRPFASALFGAGVPEELRPPLPVAPPHAAELGVSMARCGVGETGSLVLGAEDGRLVQILPPIHVIIVKSRTIHLTLREALGACRSDGLPSALALHSGPSKSADIGQILVKGAHGPGRVVALVVGP